MLTPDEILSSYRKISTIVQNKDWTWEARFDHAFHVYGEELSGKLPGFSYYDPDTTYKEDVLALESALKDYLETRYGVQV